MIKSIVTECRNGTICPHKIKLNYVRGFFVARACGNSELMDYLIEQMDHDNNKHHARLIADHKSGILREPTYWDPPEIILRFLMDMWVPSTVYIERFSWIIFIRLYNIIILKVRKHILFSIF